MTKRAQPGTLPPLPATFFSTLGPLAVGPLTVDPVRAEELFGRFLPAERRVEIGVGMHGVACWATLWHEAMHAALVDSGADNMLTEQQSEVVCDAVSAYLTAMMLAGQLTVPGKDSMPTK
jgi:hypothetical protein